MNENVCINLQPSSLIHVFHRFAFVDDSQRQTLHSKPQSSPSVKDVAYQDTGSSGREESGRRQAQSDWKQERGYDTRAASRRSRMSRSQRLRSWHGLRDPADPRNLFRAVYGF